MTVTLASITRKKGHLDCGNCDIWKVRLRDGARMDGNGIFCVLIYIMAGSKGDTVGHIVKQQC